MDIRILKYFQKVEHAYPDFNITLHGFLCTCDSTDLVLTEHIGFNWMDRDLIATLDWAAADIPIVDKIVYEGEG